MPSTNPSATDPKLPAAGSLAGAGGKFDLAAAKARVVELRDENKRLEQRALLIAKEGGELLLQIKAHLKHGEFTVWKKNCFDKSTSSAGEWMKIAKHWPELVEEYGAKIDTLTLKAALQFLRKKDKEDEKYSVAFLLGERRKTYDAKSQRLWTKTNLRDATEVERATKRQKALRAWFVMGGEKTERPAQPIAKVFLDSGAFSQKEKADCKEEYYDTEQFWDRLNQYGRFLQKYGEQFDYYANLDAIGFPDLTYRHQLYLEHRYGVKPVPVLHFDRESPTSYCEWLKRYRNMGHTYIGIGGKGKAELEELRPWLNDVFGRNSDLKFHGFGIMSSELLMAFPWTSVDAASWTKIAAYGDIQVPHFLETKVKAARSDKRIKWDYSQPAEQLHVSEKTPPKTPLTEAEQERIARWKETVSAVVNADRYDPDYSPPPDLPVEKHSSWRRLANLYYYERLAAEMAATRKDTLFYFSGTGCQFTNPEVFRNGLCVMPTFQDVRDNLAPTSRMQQIWEARARG